jgi:hypothetical protein
VAVVTLAGALADARGRVSGYLSKALLRRSRPQVDLSDDMRAELERRLALTAVEQPDDPAFRDLPALDHLGLLVLFIGSGIAAYVLQMP